MKNKVVITGLIIVLTILAISGCTEIFTSNDDITTYQSHPTKIMYTISYGYNINCSGLGDYTIKYDCDVPEVLNGDIVSIVIHDSNYEEKVLATFNIVKSWNFTGSTSKDYNLGLTAIVEAEFSDEVLHTGSFKTMVHKFSECDTTAFQWSIRRNT